MVTSLTVCRQYILSWSKISDLDLQIISGTVSKKPSWEFVGELSNTIMKSRDTRKST